jgi:formylglycine-generating enzyme required for sulfatase activity
MGLRRIVRRQVERRVQLRCRRGEGPGCFGGFVPVYGGCLSGAETAAGAIVAEGISMRSGRENCTRSPSGPRVVALAYDRLCTFVFWVALASVAFIAGDPAAAHRPFRTGEAFTDCADACPEMVVAPPGTFLMGSPPSEAGRDPNGYEDPRHRVRIGYPFAVGKYAVTRGEFARFAEATKLPDPPKCNVHVPPHWPGVAGLSWRHTPFAQTDRHPVVCVGWTEARDYAAWLSRRTGHRYRLLSEAEWEYAARAGTTTTDYWGDGQDDACAYANGVDLSLKDAVPETEVAQHCRDGFAYTAPVGSFRPNAFGLYDMMGNVFEMLADCYVRGYDGAPADGSPRIDSVCRCRSNRGGSWTSTPSGLRAAYRDCDQETTRVVDLGFRVARTIDPGELRLPRQRRIG